jgi:lipopolysaccharide export system ATP-binding protein
MSPMLHVKEITKSFGKSAVLRGLTFEVFKGEIVALLGPNGAGKTTAFYIATGLIAPDKGAVFLQGEEVTHLPMHQRAKRGLGYLAQEPSVFRTLTVEENVLAVLECQGLSRQERKLKLELLLDELHLKPLRKKKAFSLSGGERRRLEITRSLACNPSILLLDEPFANIDPISIQEVKDLCRHLASRGITILITDHNAREIFSIADRLYIVIEGRAHLEGTPAELAASQEAKERYLGSSFNF